MREFETGATRDNCDNKPDYAGFLSPIALQAYGAYMLKHQKQADGKLRSSSNWKKGMPQQCYMESGMRHFMDWWLEHEGHPSREGKIDALCGLLFNVMGYLHEEVKKESGTKEDL